MRTGSLLATPRHHPAGRKEEERDPQSLHVHLRETKWTLELSFPRKKIDLPFRGCFSSNRRRMGSHAEGEMNYRKLEKLHFLLR